MTLSHEQVDLIPGMQNNALNRDSNSTIISIAEVNIIYKVQHPLLVKALEKKKKLGLGKKTTSLYNKSYTWQAYRQL